MKLLGLVAAAMTADFVTFALFVGRNGAFEMNPVMAVAYARFGLLVVGLLKVVTTVAVLLLVGRCRNSSARFLAALLGTSIGMLGTFGNLAAGAT